MRTRVGILEDVIGLSRWLLPEMESSDMDTYFIEPEQNISSFNSNDYDIIVHFCTKENNSWELCNQIKKVDEHLPILHIHPGGSCIQHVCSKNRLHKEMSALLAKGDMIAIMLELIESSKIEKKLSLNEYQIRKWEQIEQLLVEEASGENFLQTLINYLAQEFKADKVFAVHTKDLNYFRNEYWKIHALDSRKSRDEARQFFCSNDLEISELSGLLDQLTSSKLDGKIQTDRIALISKRINDKEYLFFPITDPSSSEVVVSCWLENPKEWQQTRVREAAPKLLRQISRLFLQNLKYLEMEKKTYIDDVSSLYNQRYLAKALDSAILRASKENESFSVLFIDVDHFKKVNDTKGHLVGSGILSQLGDIIRENIRDIDVAFRYGGDEFLIILTDTDSKIALSVGERIRNQVENTVFEILGSRIEITLSIGIACYPEHATTKEDVIELADQAMYYGKNKSRNIVFVAS